MNILIIEDEKPAADQLLRLLKKEIDEAWYHGPIASIEDSKKWLKENAAPDLIFMDIHLSDGPSFEIFEDLEIDSPIIFCTAYDQYALKAFKLNSLDYLLKPVEPKDLKRALDKFRHWKQDESSASISAEMIKNILQSNSNNYKNRFVIKVAEKLHVIETTDIDFFVSAGKYTFLQTSNGRQYPVDQSLDRLQEILDPNQFYRISRKYIISIPAIEEVRTYSSSRLKLQLRNCKDDDVMVSRDRTSDFKKWLDS